MFIINRLQKNIQTKNKLIVTNNVFVEHYVDSVQRKVEDNGKNSLFEYFIYFGFCYCVTKDLICLTVDESNIRTRLYLFDMTLFMGGVKHFTIYVLILAFTCGGLLFKYFHLSRDEKIMKWIVILEYISGRKAISDFTDIKLSRKQDGAVKLVVRRFITITNVVLGFMGYECLYIYILVTLYDTQAFIYSQPIQVIGNMTWWVFMHDMGLFSTFCVSCGFLMLVILHNTNTRLTKALSKKKINRFRLRRELRQFMADHNEICRLFLVFNRFWSKTCFVLFLTLVPINLIWLHTILFEKVDRHIMIYMSFITAILGICIFTSQYFYAYLSKQIHRNTKIIARVQWSVKGWPFRLSTKLKLMAYFERLSANKKIGITLGPTVTLTLQVFAQFVIKYIRYFILIHRLAGKMKN